MCKYKLVTFDITGTLLKFRKSVGEEYAETGKKFGLIIKPDDVNKNFGNNYKHFCKKFPNFGSGTIGWKSWWKHVVHNSFRDSYDGNVNEGDIDKIYNHLLNSYTNNTSWVLADGALELLDTLHSNNVTLGVISNFDVRLHQLLHEMKLHDYFKFIITSYECGILKPDQEIFKLAEKLSVVNENDLKLHIGDNFELDFKAARNAGWSSLLLSRNKSKPSNTESDMCFSDLISVRNFMLSANHVTPLPKQN